MRADIEERLSTEPINRMRKNEKTTWIDIALGIYVGGIGLLITSAIAGAIVLQFQLNAVEIELKKIEPSIYHRQ